MKYEVTFKRYCEACKEETPHILKESSWMRMQAQCVATECVLEEDSKGREVLVNRECGLIHIFTLTHLRSDRDTYTNEVPFTRCDLGVELK